jgi:Leucine Rich repeat
MQRGFVHRRILDPIRRLLRQIQDDDDDENSDEEHTNRLIIRDATFVDRQSLQYLVDFLQDDESTHDVTELELLFFSFPLHGGLNVLCDFFANQTTLIAIRMEHCDFGSIHENLQLFAAMQRNRFVIDLNLNIDARRITDLRDAVLGNCISGFLLNMPQLQRLGLAKTWLNAETVRAFQPALRSNRYLKILDLSCCDLHDEGLCLVTDALVGNSTVDVLDIDVNEITPNGLTDITRLVKFTQLKSIRTAGNDDFFADMDAIKNLISVLHQHTSLEEFTIEQFDHDSSQQEEAVFAIDNILARNVSMRHSKELLALPRTGLSIRSKSGIWYMAIAKMGTSSHQQADRYDDDDDVDSDSDSSGGNGTDYAAAPTSYPGASAIFKIFQARPAILE